VRAHGKGRKGPSDHVTANVDAVIRRLAPPAARRHPGPACSRTTGRRLYPTPSRTWSDRMSQTAEGKATRPFRTKSHSHTLRHSAAMALLHEGVRFPPSRSLSGWEREPAVDEAVHPRRPHAQGEGPWPRPRRDATTGPGTGRRTSSSRPREPGIMPPRRTSLNAVPGMSWRPPGIILCPA